MECNSQGWGEGHYEGMTSHKLLRHNCMQGAKMMVGPHNWPQEMLARCAAAQIIASSYWGSNESGLNYPQGALLTLQHLPTSRAVAVLGAVLHGAAAATGLGSVSSAWPPLNHSVPPRSAISPMPSPRLLQQAMLPPPPAIAFTCRLCKLLKFGREGLSLCCLQLCCTSPSPPECPNCKPVICCCPLAPL